mmetsp:Transcript_28292/g.70009  ORF Transcript_28292/g.70009 Transcript_28292/m.70009 type:complete len:180 (+) Transcript_28292:130-669(+)
MPSGPPPQPPAQGPEERGSVLQAPSLTAGPRAGASRVRTSGKGAHEEGPRDHQSRCAPAGGSSGRAGAATRERVRGGGVIGQRRSRGGAGGSAGGRPMSAAPARGPGAAAEAEESGVASLYVPESRLRRSKVAVDLNLDRIPSVNELSRLSMYLTQSQHFVLMQHIRSVQRISALAVKV